jgi:hypothetical protein
MDVWAGGSGPLEWREPGDATLTQPRSAPPPPSAQKGKVAPLAAAVANLLKRAGINLQAFLDKDTKDPPPWFPATNDIVESAFGNLGHEMDKRGAADYRLLGALVAAKMNKICGFFMSPMRAAIFASKVRGLSSVALKQWETMTLRYREIFKVLHAAAMRKREQLRAREARKAQNELFKDLVVGTGLRGRVTLKDMQEFLARKGTVKMLETDGFRIDGEAPTAQALGKMSRPEAETVLMWLLKAFGLVEGAGEVVDLGSGDEEGDGSDGSDSD